MSKNEKKIIWVQWMCVSVAAMALAWTVSFKTGMISTAAWIAGVLPVFVEGWKDISR